MVPLQQAWCRGQRERVRSWWRRAFARFPQIDMSHQRSEPFLLVSRKSQRHVSEALGSLAFGALVVAISALPVVCAAFCVAAGAGRPEPPALVLCPVAR